jgi:Tol biopolymer transport system component
MNTKLKKFLIIVIVILVVVLVGLLVYNFVIKKQISPQGGEGGLPSGEEGQGQGGGEEQTQPRAQRKIKAISQEPVFAATINASKNAIVYYLRSNGNVWQIDFDGSNPAQISSSNLENLIKVLWSPDKNKVITIFQDNLENISKFFYDYATAKALPLNKYINYVTWSPDSKKIAYQYQNDATGDNNINTANPDGSKFNAIMNTRMKNLIVEWPQGAEIFLREKPSGLVQSSLYALNPLTKAFNKIIADAYGFSTKWSIKGDKILYSKTNQEGEGIRIYIANRNGSNEKALDVFTLAEKCVWSQDTRYIYCAIPRNISEAKLLPDDFYKGTFIGNDEFYKININTSEMTNVLEGEQITDIYDAIELFLSPNEDYLFFVNKGDGLLYAIKL